MKTLSFLFIIFTLLSACSSRPVEPTRSSRHAIDTLFNQKTLALKPEIDSLCKELYGKVYSTAVDSIMDARKMEMDILVE